MWFDIVCIYQMYYTIVSLPILVLLIHYYYKKEYKNKTVREKSTKPEFHSDLQLRSSVLHNKMTIIKLREKYNEEMNQINKKIETLINSVEELSKSYDSDFIFSSE